MGFFSQDTSIARDCAVCNTLLVASVFLVGSIFWIEFVRGSIREGEGEEVFAKGRGEDLVGVTGCIYVGWLWEGRLGKLRVIMEN